MKRFFFTLLLGLSCLGADFSWMPYVQLSNPTEEAYYPSLAMDPQGNAVATWTDYRKSLGQLVIQSATKLYGQPWSAAQDISSIAEAVSNSVVRVDSQGNAVAVWGANVAGNALRSATKLFGQPWSVPDLVPTGGDAEGFDFALDNNGNVTLIWYGQSGMNFQVFASQRTLMGAWSPAQLLSGGGTDEIYPALGIDAAGNVIATWEDAPNIVAAIKPYGMGWQLPATTIISMAATSFYAPLISVNAAGDATVVASGTAGVGSAYKPFNQPWQPSQIIPGSSTSPDSRPNVVLDSHDNAMTVWNNVATFGSSISVAGQSWSAPVLTSGNFSTIDINSCDLVLLAINGVEVTSGMIGGIFSPLMTIGSGFAAVVAQNPCGHAMVLWTGNLGAPTDIEAAEGMVPGGVSSLSGFQRKDDFGFVSQYENCLRWTVASTTNITGFAIFRNGIMIAKVKGNQFSYVDVQQKKNVPVVYGVAIIVAGGGMSAPTLITVP